MTSPAAYCFSIPSPFFERVEVRFFFECTSIARTMFTVLHSPATVLDLCGCHICPLLPAFLSGWCSFCINGVAPCIFALCWLFHDLEISLVLMTSLLSSFAVWPSSSLSYRQLFPWQHGPWFVPNAFLTMILSPVVCSRNRISHYLQQYHRNCFMSSCQLLSHSGLRHFPSG